MDNLNAKLPPPPPETASQLKGEDAIFIPIDSPVFYAWFDKNTATFPPEILRLPRSFRKNLEGASTAVFMPVSVGVGLGMKQRLDELYLEEKTARNLKKADDSPDALRAAKDLFEKEIDDPQKRHTWTSEAIASMEYLYQSKQYEHAAFELLRQGSVLAWLAIENLARDSFLTLVKLRPNLAVELVQDEAIRARFPVGHLNSETVTRPDFDGVGTLAALPAAFDAPDAVAAMQAVFRVLMPKAAQLQSLLRRREFLILNQRYHLITHRFAIVDQDYVDATHEHIRLHVQVPVSSQDLREYLSIVRDVGIEILKGLVERLSEGK